MINGSCSCLKKHLVCFISLMNDGFLFGSNNIVKSVRNFGNLSCCEFQVLKYKGMVSDQTVLAPFKNPRNTFMCGPKGIKIQFS